MVMKLRRRFLKIERGLCALTQSSESMIGSNMLADIILV